MYLLERNETRVVSARVAINLNGLSEVRFWEVVSLLVMNVGHPGE